MLEHTCFFSYFGSFCCCLACRLDGRRHAICYITCLHHSNQLFGFVRFERIRSMRFVLASVFGRSDSFAGVTASCVESPTGVPHSNSNRATRQICTVDSSTGTGVRLPPMTKMTRPALFTLWTERKRTRLQRAHPKLDRRLHELAFTYID